MRSRKSGKVRGVGIMRIAAGGNKVQHQRWRDHLTVKYNIGFILKWAKAKATRACLEMWDHGRPKAKH